MAPISTTMKASPRLVIPSNWVRIRKIMRPTKADSMKMSPWAKFTIPMMPNTIV